MTILEAVVLGILQGVTEFLPVSSSGHLALMQHFLGLKEPQVFFDVMLHLGTLGAVVIAYKQSIRKLAKAGFSAVVNPRFYRRPIATINGSSDLKLIWFVLLGSVPTGAIAIVFKQQIEALFAKPTIVAVMLIMTGVILQLPRLRRNTVHKDLPGAVLAFAAYRNSSGLSHHTWNFKVGRYDLFGATLRHFSETGSTILIPSLHSGNSRRSFS